MIYSASIANIFVQFLNSIVFLNLFSVHSRMSKCKVQNIKHSLKIKPEFFNQDIYQKLQPSKDGNSYIVVRNKFVYIIFTNGHINITKVRTFRQISESKNHILQLLDLPLEAVEFNKIDNIVGSGRMKSFSHFPKFLCFLRNCERMPVHYNPEKFPGARTEVENCVAILFTSGKYNFVGAKTWKEIQQAEKELLFLRWKFEGTSDY